MVAKITIKYLIVMCILFTLAVTGCDKGSDQSKEETGGPVPEENSAEEKSASETDNAGIAVEEWEIPFLNVLSGPIAGIGRYLLWGAERAAYELNQSGGIAGTPVSIKGIDTGLSPEQGAVEMAKITEAGALTALGPVPEPVIMAAMPIAVESRMLAFTATTSYEYAVEFFPWSISWFAPTDTSLPPIVTAWCDRFPEMKTVIQLVENYGPWPGMADAHKIGLEKAGKKALKRIEVPTDAVISGPFVVNALSQRPDGIIVACGPEKSGKIIKELIDRGWDEREKILIFNSADDAALYTTGGDSLDGCMIYNYTNPGLEKERWTRFKEAYQADHDGMLPPSLAINYYDAVYMIKEAIEKTGITGDPEKLMMERKKLAEYCRNVDDFEGIQFTWSMEDGVPTDRPLFLFRITGGTKELVQEVRPEEE